MEYTLLVLDDTFNGINEYKTISMPLGKVLTSVELHKDNNGFYFDVNEQLRHGLMDFEVKNLSETFLNYLSHLENNKDESELKNKLLNIINLRSLRLLIYDNGKILYFEDWFWAQKKEVKVYVKKAYTAIEKFLVIWKITEFGEESYEVYESTKDGYDDELVFKTNNINNELNQKLEQYKDWKIYYHER